MSLPPYLQGEEGLIRLKWFAELQKMRTNAQESYYQNQFDNIWKVITQPYSDQAHFIYELLQNADDVNATEIKFELFSDKLIFTHNGSQHFTITDPQRDATLSAKQAGTLGDLNAIVGIGLGNNDQGQTIGTFGIGFKSVFVYTKSPKIYDDNMWFEINDYIVPKLLDSDYQGRVKGTTVFVFPFDQTNQNMNPQSDILNKLKNLVLPTLFLRTLEKITWIQRQETGEYAKCISKTKTFKANEGYEPDLNLLLNIKERLVKITEEYKNSLNNEPAEDSLTTQQLQNSTECFLRGINQYQTYDFILERTKQYIDDLVYFSKRINSESTKQQINNMQNFFKEACITDVSFVTLKKSCPNQNEENTFLMFSRYYEGKKHLKYSISFLLGKQGGIIKCPNYTISKSNIDK